MSVFHPRFLVLFFGVAILMAVLMGETKAGQLIYTNPVCAVDMPDPSVKKFGDYYYAFGTTGNARMRDGRIFRLLRSQDLVHWEALGGALTPPFTNGWYQYWAPEITENGGGNIIYITQWAMARRSIL